MVTWEHLRRIRDSWSGPLVVKGLMHPEDARQAVHLGVDGLVVSNHGGRQLDAAPSPLDVLPAMRAVVGAGLPILLDSGVRRGSDIVTARCLGADACIFGRPTLYGVAAAAQAGAEMALKIMRKEVDQVLAQVGCRRFDELCRAQIAGRTLERVRGRGEFGNSRGLRYCGAHSQPRPARVKRR